MMRRVALVAVVAASGVFASCGAAARQDATTSGQSVDRSPAEVLAMPDQFRNVADKCDGHGHRVYANSTGNKGTGAQLFVINDPSCN